MPTLLRLSRSKVIAGYVAFSLAAFALLFYLTFPYDAVEKRLSAEAASQGLHVTFKGLGRGFSGSPPRPFKSARNWSPVKTVPPSLLW